MVGLSADGANRVSVRCQIALKIHDDSVTIFGSARIEIDEAIDVKTERCQLRCQVILAGLVFDHQQRLHVAYRLIASKHVQLRLAALPSGYEPNSYSPDSQLPFPFASVPTPITDGSNGNLQQQNDALRWTPSTVYIS